MEVARLVVVEQTTAEETTWKTKPQVTRLAESISLRKIAGEKQQPLANFTTLTTCTTTADEVTQTGLFYLSAQHIFWNVQTKQLNLLCLRCRAANSENKARSAGGRTREDDFGCRTEQNQFQNAALVRGAK